MTALAITHKREIIERLSGGETATSIARSFGLKSHSAISHVLADDPDYQAARIDYHVARLDAVEGMITDSTDQLTLARARELATMYRWRAQTEARQVWGKDSVDTATDTNLNTISTLLLTQAIKSLPKPQVIDNVVDVVEIRTTDVKW